jgi:hypothetical protein
MKKLFAFFLVFLSCQFAYADLDGNFDYMNIQTECFSNAKFKKTTLAEFRAKYQNFKLAKLPDGQVMLVSHPKVGQYSEIRVGFNKNVIEWIEFILKEKGDLAAFLSRYGEADDINRDYNEVYDYYNYDVFNVSADKQGEYIYSVTLFDNPKMPEEMLAFDKKLPDLENLTYLHNFIPNEYLEETFSDNYDCLYPKFNDDGTKTYTVKDNVISQYSKAEFVFRDGLLKGLVLYPKNITFEKISQVYGKNFKINKAEKDRIIYDYGNFSVATNLKNKVLHINLD